jgi:hypothetical protein
LIFNYETFQQANSHVKVRELIERHVIDLVMVDEILKRLIKGRLTFTPQAGH